MLRRYALFLSVLLGTLWGCQAQENITEVRDGVTYVINPRHGSHQDQATAPLRFELEQVFGAEEEPRQALLFGIASVVTDDQGTVYVLDIGDNRLVAFNPDGSVRWQTGRQGQGPGEFQRPRGLAWDGDSTLYTANQGGSRIDAFDTNRDFLYSHLLVEHDLYSVRLRGFLPPRTLVLSQTASGHIGTEAILLEMGDPWEKKTEFMLDQSEGLRVLGNTSIGLDLNITDGELAFGNHHLYRLHFFDTLGTLKRVVSRDLPHLVRPGFWESMDGNSRSISTYSNVSAPLRLASGHWLSSAFWATNVPDPDEHLRLSRNGNAPDVENAYTLDLFDEEGKLLYSLTGEGSTPDIGQLAHVDAAGKLYTIVFDPYPQVRRYRIVLFLQ